MEKKPKKQIHSPQFLYRNKGNVTAQQPLPSEKLSNEPPPPSTLELYNHTLVSLIDTLPAINGFFQIATMDEKQQVKETTAYQESDGTYAELLANQEKSAIDATFNTLEAQKYMVLQLWVKAEDAHGHHILIRRNSAGELLPIPINYRRCLAHNFHSNWMIPRTTRWEGWPQLEQPLDPVIRKLILDSDPHALTAALKAAFNKTVSLSPEEQELFDCKFTHFTANMIMLNRAIQVGLTLKQTLALILPVIDNYAFHFVTAGTLKGGELWPARDRFLQLSNAFVKAWNAGRKWHHFCFDTFEAAIIAEIEAIHALSPEVLFERYFNEIAFELRRSLYL